MFQRSSNSPLFRVSYSLLEQEFRFHERVNPGLFLILPQDSSSWNYEDFFSNKFRGYALCECGEDTRSTNRKILHHIHFTNHQGYDITCPEISFRQCASSDVYATALKMLKIRTSEAGVTVPVISRSIHANATDSATASPEHLNNMARIMDQIISHLERISVEEKAGLAVGMDIRQQPWETCIGQSIPKDTSDGSASTISVKDTLKRL